MSKKKDPADWGPVPGQLELDFGGDAIGWDRHSGQHGDVFVTEVDQDDFVDHVHRGAPVIDTRGWSGDDVVDYVNALIKLHRKDKEAA